MKIGKSKKLQSGETQVVVTLKPGESLVSLLDASFYRLGEPVSDVVGVHILENAQRVAWCSVSQDWVSC